MGRHKTKRITPKPERPVCPRWLGPEEKRIWKQLVPALHEMGLLVRVDGFALARYCVSWVIYRKCLAYIKKHGTFQELRNADGEVVNRGMAPEVKLMKQEHDNLKRAEALFGMSPAVRSRIAFPEMDTDPDTADIYSILDIDEEAG